MNLNIGLDLDGVVYNWHQIVYREFGEKTGKDFDTFWCNPHDSFSEDEWNYIVSIPTYYESLMLTDNDKRVLNKLSELGELFYITARDSSLRFVTEKFFNKNQVPFKENLFLTKDKGYLARMLRLDYFVDDFISHYDSVAKTCKAYLFARPWNRNDREGRNVIFSLEELYEDISKPH